MLAGGAARHESVTFDEVAHIAAGVSYLQRLDMRMNEEHPPLAKVVAALPLVLRGAHADYSHLSWTFSNKIFNQYLGEWVFGHWFLMRWNDLCSTMLWARVPMLWMTLSLGFTLYIYGSRLGGQWAVVSANFMEDSGNCVWLMQYSHQVLAGGSMYAVHLPQILPPAGQPGGPPLPADYRYFAGMPKDLDTRSIFMTCVRDPQQLQPTMDRFQAMQTYGKKK
ncbi:MAG: hypothetical protein WB952_14980 [Terriglobales bacterium]